MQNVDNIAMMEDDTETEEALAEFDFLVEEAENGAGEAQSHGDGPEWGNVFPVCLCVTAVTLLSSFSDPLGEDPSPLRGSVLYSVVFCWVMFIMFYRHPPLFFIVFLVKVINSHLFWEKFLI